MHRHTRSLVCAALLATVLAFACPAAAATGARPEPGTLALEACRVPLDDPAGSEVDARCGTLAVPENRALPDGRTLSLRVVVLPARSETPREPVFVLAGGPGQAATDLVSRYAGAAYRADRDLVFMDMRGTGDGSRLDCDMGGSDENPQSYLEPLFFEGAGYAACRDRLASQADLTQYTLPISLTDLDELRRALGHDRVVLDGGSFGTRAGLTYIRMFGPHVRAAVLNGVIPVDNRSPLHHAAAAQQAFDRLADQCEAEAACRSAYPDVRGDLAAVLARLEAAPAEVIVAHPATDAPIRLRLSAPAFADGLRVMLYSAESGRRVPLLLRQARAGDPAPFAEAAMRSSRGLKQALRLGLLLSATCSEDVWRIDPDEVARETTGSFIGDSRVRGQMAACSIWPRGAVPADHYAPFRSDVPVLFISGALDPVTPSFWVDRIQPSLPNSVHVILPGGHAHTDACVEAMSSRFVALDRAADLDRRCVEDETLPPFELPPDLKRPPDRPTS